MRLLKIFLLFKTSLCFFCCCNHDEVTNSICKAFGIKKDDIIDMLYYNDDESLPRSAHIQHLAKIEIQKDKFRK